MNRFSLLLALSALACKGDKDDSGDPSDLPEIGTVEASLSETIPTVITVSWDSDSSVTGRIEFGADGALDHSTPLSESGTSHEALLLGMTADTEVSYRVVLESDAGTVEGDTQTITTGPFPLGLPDTSTTGDNAGQYMIVPWLGVSTGIMVLDPEGQIVWWWTDESDLQVYRARLSLDGESILYNAGSISGDPSEESQLVRVALDGSEVSAIDIPLLAHDFVELEDGTIGAMVIEIQEGEDGEEVRGDTIVEIAPDGTQTTIWSSFETWDYNEVNSGDEGDVGWTFANALDYDAQDDTWMLSIRNFSSIVKIDRATGELLWGFGGVVNDFDITGTPFLHEHQFDLDGDSMLVFDNDGLSGNQSRVVEYSFDEEARTAEETWSYVPDPSVYCFVLGDVERIENDDRLVTWSAAGAIERVTADGEMTWQLTTPLGYVLGFNSLESSLYRGL
jgi:hypothetical protein